MQDVNLRCAQKQNAPVRKTGAMRLAQGLLPCQFIVALGRRSSKWPAWPSSGMRFSEPIQDLVGPEALEPVQRLVQRRELLVRDAADLLHRLDVLLIERVDDLADFLALRGQADANRAAINARALMIEEAEFDELLEVIGDVGAEVVTARAQFARGQF